MKLEKCSQLNKGSTQPEEEKSSFAKPQERLQMISSHRISKLYANSKEKKEKFFLVSILVFLSFVFFKCKISLKFVISKILSTRTQYRSMDPKCVL